MSEMVERVGLAIMAALEDSNPDTHGDDYARAAIAALREPTEAMVLAACNRPDADDDNRVGIWRAMIDAALRA